MKISQKKNKYVMNNNNNFGNIYIFAQEAVTVA